MWIGLGHQYYAVICDGWYGRVDVDMAWPGRGLYDLM